MATPPAAQPNPYAIVAGVVGTAYCIAALAVMLGPAALTSHAGRDPLVAEVAGFALVTAGIAATGRDNHRIRTATTLATVVWFAPVLVGWADGPPWLRAAAGLVVPLLAAAAVHLVASCAGWLQSAVARKLVLACYAAAFAVSVTEALFRDPANDPTCWANCVTNVLLLHSAPGIVNVADTIHRWFQIACGAGLLIAGGLGLRAAGRQDRFTRWPVLAGGAVVGVTAAAHAVRVSGTIETAADPVFRSLFVAQAAGLVLVASGPVLATLRRMARRRAIDRVTAELAALPAPGALQAVLAQAVGDPGLTLAYWVPAAGCFVDAEGHREPDAPSAPGSSTLLTRDGEPVARIRHRPDAAEAVAALGAGTHLAVDNERLRAALLLQAADIQRSRERIIAAGDAARRDAERDLHDGAQQRLLALTHRLAMARSTADRGGDVDTAALVGEALEQTLAGLAELRELAHGIYPAVLTRNGLGPALESIRDAAEIPVDVTVRLGGPLPTPVAMAAYVTVREAIVDAGRRSATGVDVAIEQLKDRLVITVLEDGVPDVPRATRAADRIGAIGGQLRFGPGSLEADLPCG